MRVKGADTDSVRLLERTLDVRLGSRGDWRHPAKDYYSPVCE